MTTSKIQPELESPASAEGSALRTWGEVAVIVTLMLSVSAVVLLVAVYAGKFGRLPGSGATSESASDASEFAAFGQLP